MKILLFGSTGMLGCYVNLVLGKTYNVKCINRINYDIENDSFEKLEEILTSNLQENDIIINCAGIIPQKYKKDDYKTFILVNTLFPHKLNEFANKHEYKFIHITTDCVYNGIKGNYCENDIHTANDIYGTSKSLGEPQNATIIRTSIIGEELSGKKSLIEWVKSNANGEINGFTNHLWNGLSTNVFSELLKTIIINNIDLPNIIHIIPKDKISKYTLLKYFKLISNNKKIKINKKSSQHKINRTLDTKYHSKNLEIWNRSIYTKQLNLKSVVKTVI
jgi:dTDP-4-dehydrorhamnose reductase